ncbi:cytochrome c peroxidase [Muricoccus radiodurans]|uniref:cytochrome c peroxidase n=1 Tax=Muricoccus radiodurans TaxID=2231721 RepID=UPI003CEE23B9
MALSGTRLLDLGLGAALAFAAGATALAVATPGPAPDDSALRVAFRRPDGLPEAPQDNPASPAKEELGRRLFFDPALSASGTTACASCHQPARGFSDGRPLARGADGRPLRRRTPTLWNLAWAPFLFWDGRAEGLEAQAEAPIEAHEEMGQPLDALVERLGRDASWRRDFGAAFPDDPAPVSRRNLTRAIAAWERTLVSPRTRFDAWVEGDDGALTASERRGLDLFTGRGGCAACHSGWAFTDYAFYDIGLPSRPGAAPDLGRGPVIGIARADRAFKTPTLRETLRGGDAPYMHDGSVPTLAAVVDHYAAGVEERPTLAPELPRRLDLSPADRADLLAFLATLTSSPDAPLPRAATPPPATPPSAGPPQRLARVSQRGRQFAPGRVSLTRGGVLEIANDDTTIHNIRVDAPELRLNSGVQDPGQTVRWRLDRPGRFVAFCGIHPRMRLEIEVAAP